MCGLKSYMAVGVLIFSALLSCKKVNDSTPISCNEINRPHDSYVYPIRPGTPQWSHLASGDEMLKACQIPDSVVKKISTEGLIQSWLDFPLANEILLANSLQRGVQFFIENFSGLKELCAREDAGQKLYERYQKMNPLCITRFTRDTDKAAYTFSYTYLEMLLGQDLIINRLTTSQKRLLVAEALIKYNSKMKYKNYFGQLGEANSLFVCGRAMQNSQYEPFLTEIQQSPSLHEFLRSFLLPADINEASHVFNTTSNYSFQFIK